MASKQKLTAFEALHEEGRESDLQTHADFHNNRSGAKLICCYLPDCDLRPVIHGSIELIKKELASCTKKEYQILLDKDFLREFDERERKIILGGITDE